MKHKATLSENNVQELLNGELKNFKFILKSSYTLNPFVNREFLKYWQ